MKRKLILFSIILIVLSFTLMALGRNGQYLAEKKLWHLNKKLNNLLRDPGSIPDASFAQMAGEYDKFIKKHSDSPLKTTAQLFLGQTFIPRKQYAKAREIFETVIAENPENSSAALQAMAEIGKTYSAEKDGANVVATYRRIIKAYPMSHLGFKAPYLIGKYYVDSGEKSEAREAFRDAVSYYDGVVEQYPNSILEFDALRLKSACFLALADFGSAVDIYEDVLLRASGTKYMNATMSLTLFKLINSVCIHQLNDYDRPMEIYQAFLKKYPEHPLREVVKGIMTKIEEMKKEKMEEKMVSP